MYYNGLFQTCIERRNKILKKNKVKFDCVQVIINIEQDMWISYKFRVEGERETDDPRIASC